MLTASVTNDNDSEKKREMILVLVFSFAEAMFEFDNFSELKRCNSNLDGGPTVPDETMKLMLDEMLDNSK